MREIIRINPYLCNPNLFRGWVNVVTYCSLILFEICNYAEPMNIYHVA